MIINITGDGKGKTTSALGVAFRALGHNKKIIIIQFMKTKNSGEYNFIKQLNKSDKRFGKKILIYNFGTNYFLTKSKNKISNKKIGNVELKKIKEIKSKDKILAEKGLKKAFDCLKQKPFLLILDEINTAVYFGLLNKRKIIKFLRSVPKETNVVLTGRNSPQDFIKISDIVSEIKCVKHYFSNNSKIVGPIRGIDF
ncbi:MAG: cob(I)yrinic acid a,c-diamide adenosyltransferase [Candidatus Woesearchaeota archaeon]